MDSDYNFDNWDSELRLEKDSVNMDSGLCCQVELLDNLIEQGKNIRYDHYQDLFDFVDNFDNYLGYYQVVAVVGKADYKIEDNFDIDCDYQEQQVSEQGKKQD